MVRPRRGAGQLGCLVILMVFTAVVYFGLNIGVVFWHYWQFQDRMRDQAHFAGHLSTTVIKTRLSALADSLGLPESAHIISVRRTAHAIYISADYSEHIELPLFVREIHFNPQATGAF